MPPPQNALSEFSLDTAPPFRSPTPPLRSPSRDLIPRTPSTPLFGRAGPWRQRCRRRPGRRCLPGPGPGPPQDPPPDGETSPKAPPLCCRSPFLSFCFRCTNRIVDLHTTWPNQIARSRRGIFPRRGLFHLLHCEASLGVLPGRRQSVCLGVVGPYHSEGGGWDKHGWSVAAATARATTSTTATTASLIHYVTQPVSCAMSAPTTDGKWRRPLLFFCEDGGGRWGLPFFCSEYA